ncbi:MAG: hypothetical protein U0929_12585 [Planctomycetaceae bacterium]
MISRYKTLCVLLCVTWLVRPQPLIAQGESPTPEASTDAKSEAPSPLLKEPTTPDEYMEAVLYTLKIASPEVTKKYIDGLLVLDPDDATLIGFRTKHGSAAFLQMARIEELNPAATELLERLNAASSRQANDPVFMDGLLKNLSGSPREADLAMRDLQHLGAPAVARLVEAGADLNSGVDREQAFIALTRMGEPAVAPLIGFLNQGDESQKLLATEAFGWVASKHDSPYLYAIAFSETNVPGLRDAAKQSLSRLQYKDSKFAGRFDGFGAAAELRSLAERLLKGDEKLEPEEDGLIPVWVRDKDSNSFVEKRVSPHSAAIFRAEQFARQSLELSPTDKRAQSVLLNVILTRDVEGAGWDHPAPTGPGSAHEVAVLAGSTACLEALALANEQSNDAAAEALVRALADNGSAALMRTGGRRAGVVAALDHASPRVQFAAAETILKWDPQSPFPGSNRVVEILARALRSDARANGVVVDPNHNRAAVMAGFLSEMGYDTHVVPTGAQGFVEASTRGDLQVAVLHLNTIRWDLSPTIANFRADSRTRNLPIAIYGPHGFRGQVEHLLVNDPRLTFVEESVVSSGLSQQLKPFLAQMTPPALTEDQLSSQSIAAAKWLRRIAEGRSNVYDLSPAEESLYVAVSRADIGVDAITAMAVIPTASVQTHLAEAAVNSGYDAGLRIAAANLVAAHIRRHQSLLSDDLRKQLVETWNNEADPAVRAALSNAVGVQGPNEEGLPSLLKNSSTAAEPNP